MAIWKRALLLLLCVVLAVSLVACGGEDTDKDKDNENEESSKAESLTPGDENCEHTFEEWQVERNRTCEKDGKLSRECTLCGKEETKAWVATGHDFGSDKCGTCGKRTPSCKHKKAETVVIDEPTCTEYGQKNSICKSCHGILNSDYLDPLGHQWEEHEAKEPTCTEIGWYSYSLCTVCGETDYYQLEANGHNYFAGVCTVCNLSDGETGNMSVDPISKNEYTAPSISANPLAGTAATIQTHEITLTKAEQKKELSLEVTESGKYRVWITELYSGNVMSLYVYNHLGEEIGGNWYCTNNTGLTLTLEAGETYTVSVNVYSGNGATFNLNIGCQTPAVDLSQYTSWSGSFEFEDQEHHFVYVPANSGVHTLTVSNMQSGTYVSVYVYNHLGEMLMDSSYMSNGSYIYGELEAGETYYISLCYQSKLSTVDLTIGAPKAAVDVSEYNVITDSIDFKRQSNLYTFVAKEASYAFIMSGAKDNYTDISVEVLNRLGETVASNGYFSNGDSFTAALTVGETYTICVKDNDGVTPYTIDMLAAKLTVEFSGKMVVNDSMEHTRQVNHYRWTATADGDFNFYVANLESGAVNLYIYDANGEQLDYETYCYNSEGVKLYNILAGETYEIYVEHCNTLDSYSLVVG